MRYIATKHFTEQIYEMCNTGTINGRRKKESPRIVESNEEQRSGRAKIACSSSLEGEKTARLVQRPGHPSLSNLVHRPTDGLDD